MKQLIPYTKYLRFDCELCDFKTQEHSELTQYLEKTHQIGFFDKFIIQEEGNTQLNEKRLFLIQNS